MNRWATAVLAGVLMVANADARDTAPRNVGARQPGTHATSARRAGETWIASWGSSQMIAEGDNALPADQAAAVTLRQILRLSAGGDRVRIRLSNAFGTRPLAIGSARIAQTTAPATPQVVGGMALTFAGQTGAVIPAGAELYSDPVAMPVAPGADLAVSLYLPDAAVPQTGHPGARAFSYTLAGDHVADPGFVGAKQTTHWYALADIEVSGATNIGTIVAIGDSITDGYGVKPNHNTRWTDIFAERLRGDPATRGIGVVNAGIGGNRILLDGLGPNLMARFDRDVVVRSGVRWAILLEGVNDLGVLTREAPATPAQHAAIVAQITGAYAQLVARAHAHGIKIIGSTITPFGGNDYYHPGPATEADRRAINAFIRTSGLFDAVIDFDRVIRDPAHPERLATAYDSGDHLHPSETGYRKMGEAVPLALFGKATRPVIGAIAAVPVASSAAPVPEARVADTRPTIALTFDDIPAHGPLAPGQTRTDVIRGITSALAAAHAPAFGFMNAGFGLDAPADAANAIAAWRAAGLPLGNHSYAHSDLAKVGVGAIVADVVRNEAPLARAAKGTDWHWFRYPFLSEGRTPADRDAVRTALKARGYRVAAVTMSFDDYNWNPPYAACAAKRDPAAIATLETSYLTAARTAALASRARAKSQLGHDIPYVLLMHAGAFDARMLPRLLDLYTSMGFSFGTLAEAEADPYYAAAIDLARAAPSPSLQGPPSLPAPAGPPPGLCA